ncbi:TerD family protein [Nocardia sp. NPDC058519]|uniref:TerD family protein n=1 Tax=Nocardia sp. NPDC058519 TaxID=3346535 RepID=UPI003654B40C
MPAHVDIEVDASALLLGADRRVGSDADFVFCNQTESPDGSVCLLGTRATEEDRQAYHFGQIEPEEYGGLRRVRFGGFDSPPGVHRDRPYFGSRSGRGLSTMSGRPREVRTRRLAAV